MTLYYIVSRSGDMLAAFDGSVVWFCPVGKDRRKKAFAVLHSVTLKDVKTWDCIPVSDFGLWLGYHDYIEFSNVVWRR